MQTHFKVLNIRSYLNFKKSPSSIPSHVKNAMNKRKRFLHLDRIRSNAVNASHIKILNKEINSHFNGVKTEAVRKAAMGGKVNLWKAVKVAKNQNVESIPENLTLGGLPIPEGCAAESFGYHFFDKIRLNVRKTKVDLNNVYNGKCKLIVQNRNFMTKNDVDVRSVVSCVRFGEMSFCLFICAIYDACEPLLDSNFR